MFIILALDTLFPRIKSRAYNPRIKLDDDVAPKLLTDRPSDFSFHAAYLIYSPGWEKSTSQEIRSKLKKSIPWLSEKETGEEKKRKMREMQGTEKDNPEIRS